MEGRRKRRTRRGVLALTVAVCLSAAALPSSAQAYEQWYCNVVVAPNTACSSSGLHSWDFNEGFVGYQGAVVCVWMRNANNGNRRGGSFPCGVQYAWQSFNPTNDPIYNAKVHNGVLTHSFILVGHAIA